MDGKEINVFSGDSVDVPIGCMYRTSSDDSKPQVFIEVQTGISFSEEDIVRHEDDFGRL